MRLIALAFLACWAGVAQASVASLQGEECFDVEIVANIAAQVPSEPPEIGDGSIIMEWPYFIDLNVERVLKGRLPLRRLTVLSVQHTFFRRDLGSKTWWVRRNTLGGYNLLRTKGDEKPRRCLAGTPPARAYLEPANGATLEDLRKDGERRYGAKP